MKALPEGSSKYSINANIIPGTSANSSRAVCFHRKRVESKKKTKNKKKNERREGGKAREETEAGRKN